MLIFVMKVLFVNWNFVIYVITIVKGCHGKDKELLIAKLLSSIKFILLMKVPN